LQEAGLARVHVEGRRAVHDQEEEGAVAGFVQIIEMQTSRIDEVEALIGEIRDRLDDGGPSSPRGGTITADRDRQGFYLSIVEFDSHEAAMENSGRPEVSEFAARLAKLCDAPPKFYNLDVREIWQPGSR
jgi:hypothetical protein